MTNTEIVCVCVGGGGGGQNFIFGRGPLNKHFWKTFAKISAMRYQKMPIFIFSITSQWKLEVAIATKVHKQQQKTYFL